MDDGRWFTMSAYRSCIYIWRSSSSSVLSVWAIAMPVGVQYLGWSKCAASGMRLCMSKISLQNVKFVAVSFGRGDGSGVVCCMVMSFGVDLSCYVILA